MKTENQVKNLASKGRYGDSMLMHVNPAEVDWLDAKTREMTGGQGLTINPDTGQPEAFLQFLLPFLASLAPAAGTALTGIGSALGGLGAAGAGTAAASLMPALPLTAGALGGTGALSTLAGASALPALAGGAAPALAGTAAGGLTETVADVAGGMGAPDMLQGVTGMLPQDIPQPDQFIGGPLPGSNVVDTPMGAPNLGQSSGNIFDQAKADPLSGTYNATPPINSTGGTSTGGGPIQSGMPQKPAAMGSPVAPVTEGGFKPVGDLDQYTPNPPPVGPQSSTLSAQSPARATNAPTPEAEGFFSKKNLPMLLLASQALMDSGAKSPMGSSYNKEKSDEEKKNFRSNYINPSKARSPSRKKYADGGEVQGFADGGFADFLGGERTPSPNAYAYDNYVKQVTQQNLWDNGGRGGWNEPMSRYEFDLSQAASGKGDMGGGEFGDGSTRPSYGEYTGDLNTTPTPWLAGDAAANSQYGFLTDGGSMNPSSDAYQDYQGIKDEYTPAQEEADAMVTNVGYDPYTLQKLYPDLPGTDTWNPGSLKQAGVPGTPIPQPDLPDVPDLPDTPDGGKGFAQGGPDGGKGFAQGGPVAFARGGSFGGGYGSRRNQYQPQGAGDQMRNRFQMAMHPGTGDQNQFQRMYGTSNVLPEQAAQPAQNQFQNRLGGSPTMPTAPVQNMFQNRVGDIAGIAPEAPVQNGNMFVPNAPMHSGDGYSLTGMPDPTQNQDPMAMQSQVQAGKGSTPSMGDASQMQAQSGKGMGGQGFAMGGPVGFAAGGSPAGAMIPTMSNPMQGGGPSAINPMQSAPLNPQLNAGPPPPPNPGTYNGNAPASLVNGPGHGTSDSVPTTIHDPMHPGANQQAALSVDEVVLPAWYVSMQGNGSSKAGADKIMGAVDAAKQQTMGSMYG